MGREQSTAFKGLFFCIFFFFIFLEPAHLKYPTQLNTSDAAKIYPFPPWILNITLGAAKAYIQYIWSCS